VNRLSLDYPSGVYFIQTRTEGKTVVQAVLR